MKRGETYSSGWLKAQDMLDQGKVNGLDLTIKTVTTSTMNDGKVQRVLSFNEDDRELGLNVTNWDACAELSGKDDDEHWPGFVINVHPIKLDRPYNGKTHGLRIRPAQGVGPARVANHAGPSQVSMIDNAGPFWSLTDATTAVLEAGISRDDFMGYLKSKGLTKWNPATHTQLAVDFIATRKAAASAAPVDAEEIPFAPDPWIPA